MGIQPGDIVTRKSYGSDVIFRVNALIADNNGRIVAILKGIEVRLVADAPVDDLEPVVETGYSRAKGACVEHSDYKVKDILDRRKINRNKGSWRASFLMAREVEEFFDVPGNVLHIDGDEEYLTKCLDAYKKLRIPCHGFSIPEKDQPTAIIYYLEKYQPDILVITGHDGLLKGAEDFKNIQSYRNSQYFAAAIRAARKYIPGRDDLVIFAGACQSHYEELLAAGANFASSPHRIFIHIFDPVFVVEKIAFTSCKEMLAITDVVANTITGVNGVGGIETKGKFRLGYPKSPY
ncbi:MAG: sporulation peptidase YabG [Desulfitobacteriaceae bacterium]|nr:sporulation peptidase YabG [Desulfitobacteriaceae bacterium]MDD4753466.1 sporulation peptidase YabG [Desulfitobacteriaceae bacterium]